MKLELSAVIFAFVASTTVACAPSATTVQPPMVPVDVTMVASAQVERTTYDAPRVSPEQRSLSVAREKDSRGRDDSRPSGSFGFSK